MEIITSAYWFRFGAMFEIRNYDERCQFGALPANNTRFVIQQDRICACTRV